MNPRLLLVSLLLLSACASRLSSRGENSPYRLVSHLPETSKQLQKGIKRSEISLEMDFETGKFNGHFRKHSFAGRYRVEHRSAGFVKGFFYRVSLDSLSHPPTQKQKNKAFFTHLSTARQLYVAPDQLLNPTYVLLEIRSRDSTLVFVKSK